MKCLRGVIYVDVLVIESVIIGWFLLRLTALLSGRSSSGKRMCAGAFLAGFSALFALFPALAWFVALPCKLLMLVLVVIIAFPFAGWRCFLKTCFWYLATNFLLGGVMAFAVWQGMEHIFLRNGALYFHIQPLLLIGCVVGVYLVFLAIDWCFGRRNSPPTVAFTLELANTKIAGTALVDTGMHAKDAASGQEVLLLSMTQLCAKMPITLVLALKLYFMTGEIEQSNLQLRLIVLKTAAGTRALPAFTAGPLCVKNKGKVMTKKITAVFTDEVFADKSFCAILSPKLTQRG